MGRRGDDADERSVGSIDVDILDRIASHLAGSDRFVDVTARPVGYPRSVVAEYDLGYYPPHVERAVLELRWYVTDDFEIHYLERFADGATWECRWDRHPNAHNSRDHVQPPPDARSPGCNANHPDDFRDVLAMVLRRVDARIRSHWPDE